ncbi:glycosyltransferase [Candidatus Pelagibacter sp. Uisw_090]|uniref:glycosyltransferase n=1 Tax=Candidatus Pelagibacter sp. Uisw_090 TaxID=3230993 RepID=UPI0039E8AFB4
MKKIKIIHILISKGFAGSEKYLCDLIDYQSKFFDVSAIILKKNIMLKRYVNKNVKTFQVIDFFKKTQITKIISKNKPDIIHTHLSNAAKCVRKSNKFKIIATAHMSSKNSILKNCDALIVSNNTQFKEAAKSFKGALFKSYLWTRLKPITKSKLKIKSELKIPKNNIVFGSIGRFHPQKGFDLILKKFKQEAPKNSTLLLIGSGHEEFSKKIKNYKNIILLGHIDNIANYYNLLDVAVFASRWETFGFALVEAMQFELPIISSVHIGNKDWIKKFKIKRCNFNEKKKIFSNIDKTKIKYDLSIFNYRNKCSEISNIYKSLLGDKK